MIGLFFWALQNIPGLTPVVRHVAIVVVCSIAIVWQLGYVVPGMGMHFAALATDCLVLDQGWKWLGGRVPLRGFPRN